MKKTIGIPIYRLGDNSHGVTNTYLEWISTFGNPRIIMPTDDLVNVDLLILPGGRDMRPDDEVPGYFTGSSDVMQQHFYDKKLDMYIETGIPIFGICLGFQQLVSKFGCKLTQNLIWHEQSNARWSPAHELQLLTGGNIGLFNLPTNIKKTFKVNSHHHQGLEIEGIPDNLNSIIPILKSKDDNVIEAFVHNDCPIAGVQWHPEELYDGYSNLLVKQLLNIDRTKSSSETRLKEAAV